MRVREKGKGKDVIHMDNVESMMRMFAAAMEAKNNKAQELQVVCAAVQKELALVKDREYDEKFLLDELQKLLKTNAEILQRSQQTESDNKAMQQEGDLLAQQLESMTFYMKNLAMELDQERRDRQDAERRSAASKEALFALYKELRTVQAVAAMPAWTPAQQQTLHQVASHPLDLPDGFNREFDHELRAKLRRDPAADELTNTLRRHLSQISDIHEGGDVWYEAEYTLPESPQPKKQELEEDVFLEPLDLPDTLDSPPSGVLEMIDEAEPDPSAANKENIAQGEEADSKAGFTVYPTTVYPTTVYPNTPPQHTPPLVQSVSPTVGFHI